MKPVVIARPVLGEPEARRSRHHGTPLETAAGCLLRQAGFLPAGHRLAWPAVRRTLRGVPLQSTRDGVDGSGAVAPDGYPLSAGSGLGLFDYAGPSVPAGSDYLQAVGRVLAADKAAHAAWLRIAAERGIKPGKIPAGLRPQPVYDRQDEDTITRVLAGSGIALGLKEVKDPRRGGATRVAVGDPAAPGGAVAAFDQMVERGIPVPAIWLSGTTSAPTGRRLDLSAVWREGLFTGACVCSQERRRYKSKKTGTVKVSVYSGRRAYLHRSEFATYWDDPQPVEIEAMFLGPRTLPLF